MIIMIISRVSAKGLITIPAEVRRRLGIKDGDLIIWKINGEKAIIKVVKDPLKYLNGKYDDSNLTYEKVEGEADKLVLGELNAGN